MKLKYVTITGADGSIVPWSLQKLSLDFPFVEWGILMSRNNFGTGRFPSKAWIEELIKVRYPEYQLTAETNLSAHLCGDYVRELLIGNVAVFNEIEDILSSFDRIQLNFHAEKNPIDRDAFLRALKSWNHNVQFIIQLDDVNNDLLQFLQDGGVNAVGLHDLSHGAGLLPDHWPAVQGKKFTGYAGGLGPDNLSAQIKLIEQAVGEEEIWIDMETKVRSNNDKIFDLRKVKECLEISFDYTDKSQSKIA